MRADDVERRHAAGQRAEEWLLEVSEVDDRAGGLPGQRRGCARELAPGNVPFDGVQRRRLRNVSEARHRVRNAPAVRRRDEPCVGV